MKQLKLEETLRVIRYKIQNAKEWHAKMLKETGLVNISVPSNELNKIKMTLNIYFEDYNELWEELQKAEDEMHKAEHQYIKRILEQ